MNADSALTNDHFHQLPSPVPEYQMRISRTRHISLPLSNIFNRDTLLFFAFDREKKGDEEKEIL